LNRVGLSGFAKTFFLLCSCTQGSACLSAGSVYYLLPFLPSAPRFARSASCLPCGRGDLLAVFRACCSSQHLREDRRLRRADNWLAGVRHSKRLLRLAHVRRAAKNMLLPLRLVYLAAAFMNILPTSVFGAVARATVAMPYHAMPSLPLVCRASAATTFSSYRLPYVTALSFACTTFSSHHFSTSLPPRTRICSGCDSNSCGVFPRPAIYAF